MPTVFTKNRDRLLQHTVAHSFFRRAVARASDLMSDEHFTVDGTLPEAWPVRRVSDGKMHGTDGDGRNFRGQDRKNDTHASTTDPDARLYRKSNIAEARLAYLGHLLMENRHGLIVEAQASVAGPGLLSARRRRRCSLRIGALRRRGIVPSEPTKPITQSTSSTRYARSR